LEQQKEASFSQQDLLAPLSISSKAARSPALTIRSKGTASNTFSPISIVLHCEGPQTSQHGLWPDFPPIQSSNGLSFSQIRLDF